MTWTKTRSQIASTLRRDPNADVSDLRREMRTEHLSAYIERVVNQAPPLSAEQRGRIAAILHSGDAA